MASRASSVGVYLGIEIEALPANGGSVQVANCVECLTHNPGPMLKHDLWLKPICLCLENDSNSSKSNHALYIIIITNFHRVCEI